MDVKELKAELQHAHKLVTICENAGEEDAANVWRSTARALEMALLEAGEPVAG